MNIHSAIITAVLGCAAAMAAGLNCELREYRPADGLAARLNGNALELVWRGNHGRGARAVFTIRDGQPVVAELAVRMPTGWWAVLARDLTPEFEVTSGRRRISEQQLAPLRKPGIPLTPEFLEAEKWKAFWDAPLEIPGAKGTNPGLPRKPEEIRRAKASYHASTCQVKTGGARIEVTFPGLEMGIFSGQLGFTVYQGTNLLRQDAIAQTEEPSVAYKYNAGLKGFPTAFRVRWRDVARAWQRYEFGGATNVDPVAVRARNRLAIVESEAGSVAVFPPPRKFFFAREIGLDLGYVWYRKDSDTTFSMVFPRPAYWTHVRQGGQPGVEQNLDYGKVYNIGPEVEELEMLRAEQGLVWRAHPRTKGSSGYPDAVLEKPHFLSDRFLGGSYQSLPVDQSERRIRESRCFGVLDDMNNWTSAKYMIAEGDTYQKFPDDETYPHLLVNYVKPDRLPRFDEDWSPIPRAMRAGDFFVTSGEVLFGKYGIGGAGTRRVFTANVEWTFPLEFVELVWGDGRTTGSQVISATDLTRFGTRQFRVPFDAAGKKWVRFADWDSAGNGGFTEPVHFW